MTGKKYDDGKPRTDLLPPLSILAQASVLAHGAAKYGDNNWRLVESGKARYIGAALRHVFQYLAGATYDSESGLHHLAHALCSLAFVLELELEAHDRSSDRCDGTGAVSEDSGSEGVGDRHGVGRATALEQEDAERVPEPSGGSQSFTRDQYLDNVEPLPARGASSGDEPKLF